VSLPLDPLLEPLLDPLLEPPLEPLLEPPIPVLEPALDSSSLEASGVPGEHGGIDLARLLIRDPEQSLLLRVAGDSMQGAGIRHGDLLVVERCHEARAGAIVVARFGGQFTLKRLCRSPGRRWLEAAHPDYPPIPMEIRPDRVAGRADRPDGIGERAFAEGQGFAEHPGPADGPVFTGRTDFAGGVDVQLWGVAVHVIRSL